jgi:hypothetical protein
MKYEYRTINRSNPLTEKELNRIGEEGWKLCSVVINSISIFPSGESTYIFVREKLETVSTQDHA